MSARTGPAVERVGVVGGGVAGLGVAILLAEAGIAVDLVEATPDLSALGSGITLQQNALRVLRRLGVLDEVQRLGYGFSSLGMRAPDGTLLAEVPDTRADDGGLPATVGMYRPDLARLLAERAVSVGVALSCGVRATGLDQDATGVVLSCSDGTRTRYDLVIGADGVRSWTRGELGIDLEPEPVGMGIWRAFTRRPASVTRTDLCYGGAAHIAGFCPTGEDSLYAYLVEDARDRTALGPEQRLATMRELAEHYHGPWDEIRDDLVDPSRVHYTWFEWHLLDGPWHRGRTVLIGDAAHCCPPTLAQGAAQALEDALVLAELLTTRPALDDALWADFGARRLPRARAVVEGSVQLCRSLRDGDQAGVPQLMGRMSALIGQAP